jgi:hypothetical protein
MHNDYAKGLIDWLLLHFDRMQHAISPISRNLKLSVCQWVLRRYPGEDEERISSVAPIKTSTQVRSSALRRVGR